MPLRAMITSAMSRTRPLTTAQRFVGTTAIVLVFCALRTLAEPLFPTGYYFLTFLAVLLSSALFDEKCGIMATTMTAAFTLYFFVPPHHAFQVASRTDILALCIYVLTGFVASMVIETLHRSLEQLADSLCRLAESEKMNAMLLKEFRHRTRNDLQSLVSILRLRARAADSPAVKEGIMRAASHALALAQIHTRLSDATPGDGQIAKVNTNSFITGLVADLEGAALGGGLRPVSIETAVEHHALNTERGVQLGLIIHELITNALKHAFPDDQPGRVRVSFFEENGFFTLQVADNGSGLNGDDEGLGSRLLNALAAQLRGTLCRRPGSDGRGVCAELTFPVDPFGSLARK